MLFVIMYLLHLHCILYYTHIKPFSLIRIIALISVYAKDAFEVPMNF